jgi:hypothetical protein
MFAALCGQDVGVVLVRTEVESADRPEMQNPGLVTRMWGEIKMEKAL